LGGRGLADPAFSVNGDFSHRGSPALLGFAADLSAAWTPLKQALCHFGEKGRNFFHQTGLPYACMELFIFALWNILNGCFLFYIRQR
jgi:hypothetical protein